MIQTGSISRSVSLLSTESDIQTALPMAVPRPRFGLIAIARAASSHRVPMLSSQTVRWKNMASGLSPNQTTTAAANTRRMPSRRASTYSMTQATTLMAHMNSRPAMTATE